MQCRALNSTAAVPTEKRVPFALISLFTLALLSAPFARAAEGWVCSDPEWLESPEMQEGHFVGSLVMKCRIPGAAKPETIVEMRGLIEKILREERTIHGEPIQVQEKGMRGLAYDSTSRIQDGSNQLTIREEARLIDDSKKELLYTTRSKDVEGTGMAGYLKSVNFAAHAQLAEPSEGMRLELRNEVRVKRPWFAVAPIFFMIAKGTAKSKFETVKFKLLPRLVKHLGEPAGAVAEGAKP